jgi:hypothetical protein
LLPGLKQRSYLLRMSRWKCKEGSTEASSRSAVQAATCWASSTQRLFGSNKREQLGGWIGCAKKCLLDDSDAKCGLMCFKRATSGWSWVYTTSSILYQARVVLKVEESLSGAILTKAVRCVDHPRQQHLEDLESRPSRRSLRLAPGQIDQHRSVLSQENTPQIRIVI